MTMLDIQVFDFPVNDIGEIERKLNALNKVSNLTQEEFDWMDWAEQQIRINRLKELGILY